MKKIPSPCVLSGVIHVIWLKLQGKEYFHDPIEAVQVIDQWNNHVLITLREVRDSTHDVRARVKLDQLIEEFYSFKHTIYEEK